MQDESSFSVVVDEPKVTRLTVRATGGRSTWAVLTWDEKGLVTINSDHGSWVNRWAPRHLPTDTMVKFLLRIDCTYAGEKFVEGRLNHEFDGEATEACIKRAIIEARREGEYGGFSREKAREEWELCSHLVHHEDFVMWQSETALEEPWEHACYEMDHAWANFWKYLWVPGIRPVLVELDKKQGVEG